MVYLIAKYMCPLYVCVCVCVHARRFYTVHKLSVYIWVRVHM
jgi:hypothetical protein